jgi:hypothetical protein
MRLKSKPIAGITLKLKKLDFATNFKEEKKQWIINEE